MQQVNSQPQPGSLRVWAVRMRHPCWSARATFRSDARKLVKKRWTADAREGNVTDRLR